MKKSQLNLSQSTKQIAFCGLLGALALVLSSLEAMLPPMPMMPPGAKLGLSNVVTMYAASSMGLIPALVIALLKGLFAGATRGVTAMLMSSVGGLLSTVIIWILMRTQKDRVGYWGLGVAGALAHNAAQLLVAALLTTTAVFWYLPWLIIFGVLTGILTGLALRILIPSLEKIRP